jgi:hypothetical protein
MSETEVYKEIIEQLLVEMQSHQFSGTIPLWFREYFASLLNKNNITVFIYEPGQSLGIQIIEP